MTLWTSRGQLLDTSWPVATVRPRERRVRLGLISTRLTRQGRCFPRSSWPVRAARAQSSASTRRAARPVRFRPGRARGCQDNRWEWCPVSAPGAANGRAVRRLPSVPDSRSGGQLPRSTQPEALMAHAVMLDPWRTPTAAQRRTGSHDFRRCDSCRTGMIDDSEAKAAARLGPISQ